MSVPYGLTIGTQLVAKRGRRVPSVTVRQIHRADHACSCIADDGSRSVIPWPIIRRNYRVA